MLEIAEPQNYIKLNKNKLSEKRREIFKDIKTAKFYRDNSLITDDDFKSCVNISFYNLMVNELSNINEWLNTKTTGILIYGK